MPFRYLRSGGGGISLHVTEQELRVKEPPEAPLLEWTRRPGHELHAKVYREGAAYRMWTDLEGWFEIDAVNRSATVPPCSNLVRREERFWGVPTCLCYLLRGDLGIHAAAVEVEGAAVLLAAPGRFGKTTLAGAFLAAGHRLLSEDLSCCRSSPVPLLLPGPAMLRVRRDVHEQMEFPGTYPVAEDPQRIHLAVEEHLRGDGHPVPLRAAVFLRESEGTCRMERLMPQEVLPDLWTLSFKLPTDEDRARCFGDLVALANQVPVWNVYRQLTFGALPGVIETIIDTCLP
jgi:hypothetical protein